MGAKTHGSGRRRRFRWIVWMACLTFAFAALNSLWVRPMPIRFHAAPLQWDAEGPSQIVSVPGRQLVGVLGTYRRELYAYLVFDYLRSLPTMRGEAVLLTTSLQHGEREYRVRMVCPDNLLSCVPKMLRLQKRGLDQSPSWAFVLPATVRRYREQTGMFVSAYNSPVESRFKYLSPKRRLPYLCQFIRFKSSTDPRVRSGDPFSQPVLSEEQAFELAADMLAVADFYGLPLHLLIGIGAMENNYMRVRGDLNHTVWKRHKEPGDIIVRSGPRGVLVRNFSVGVWQITRETLRFAHSLFLNDQRNYDGLPPRLKPELSLDLDNVSPPVLTTYAGLLLRYLLDYFGGDVEKAIGAYNGGIKSPNLKYEAGVRHIADYARRILDRAAVENNLAP
jgi:hypothetical protein